MAENRIVWIDWVKAIGIYLVVLGHYDLPNKDITGYIFMFHMALFFFISGFLTSENSMNLSWKDFLKKKIVSLIIPYYLYQLICGIWPTILVFIGKEFNYSDLIFGSVIGLPLKMFCGPGWFLLALFWCNLLLRFNNIYINFLLLGGLLYLRYFIDRPFLMSIDTVPLAFLFYASAYYFKKYITIVMLYINKHKYIAFLFTPILFVIVGIIYSLIGQQNLLLAYVTDKPIVSIITAYMAIFAICAISVVLSEINFPFITQISNSTLFIMCIHMVIISFATLVIDIQNNMIIALISGLIITCVLTMLTPYIRRFFPLLIGYRK